MPETTYITKAGEGGSLHIAEDVIAGIVFESVRVVEGIGGFSTSLGDEISERLGKKSFSKGVKVVTDENGVIVDVFILVKYGTVIQEVAAKVQEAVMIGVKDIVGLDLLAVNVTISGIAFEKNKS